MAYSAQADLTDANPVTAAWLNAIAGNAEAFVEASASVYLPAFNSEPSTSQGDIFESGGSWYDEDHVIDYMFRHRNTYLLFSITKLSGTVSDIEVWHGRGGTEITSYASSSLSGDFTGTKTVYFDLTANPPALGLTKGNFYAVRVRINWSGPSEWVARVEYLLESEATTL